MFRFNRYFTHWVLFLNFHSEISTDVRLGNWSITNNVCNENELICCCCSTLLSDWRRFAFETLGISLKIKELWTESMPFEGNMNGKERWLSVKKALDIVTKLMRFKRNRITSNWKQKTCIAKTHRDFRLFFNRFSIFARISADKNAVRNDENKNRTLK